jgi:hypothetical protein|tara:strand:+ start:258 stop:1394 length:1137 start_codon:yes stop_codon:yes gene_type:complete
MSKNTLEQEQNMSTITETRTVTSTQARRAILKAFKKQRPIFLWGPAGIGKSELAQGIVDSGDMGNALLMDLRMALMEPTDVKGMPFYNKETGTMDWAPPVDLPSPELAKQYDTIVLFLDELNSAPGATQAAAYQLVLNRRVGNYVLPDNVVIMAAGNRETDKGIVYRMPAPLANRFVHLEMRVDYNSWLDWAVENEIHSDVIGHITVHKQDLFDFDPKGSSRAFATPRSWTFVSDLIDDEDLDDETFTDLVAGSVGEGIAVKFMATRKARNKLPNPTDILTGKTKTLDQSVEMSGRYSLTMSLCYELKDLASKKGFTQKPVENFLRFMMDNFDAELTVMGAQTAIVRYGINIKPKELPSFKEFHERFGQYIRKARSID